MTRSQQLHVAQFPLAVLADQRQLHAVAVDPRIRGVGVRNRLIEENEHLGIVPVAARQPGRNDLSGRGRLILHDHVLQIGGHLGVLAGKLADGVAEYDPALGTVAAGDGTSIRLGLNGGQNTVLGDNSFAALLVQGTQ